jgi:hypothetical protein
MSARPVAPSWMRLGEAEAQPAASLLALAAALAEAAAAEADETDWAD